MKNKFVVSLLNVEPELFGSTINIEVYERKKFYHRWKLVEKVQAQCKSWNAFEGYEWYNLKNNNRIRYSIESNAYDLAKKVLKNSLTGVPILVDWNSLKQKYPILK